MIAFEPREGCGYGIIRMSDKLVHHLSSFVTIYETNLRGGVTQRYLDETGLLEEIRHALKLPDEYRVHGLYMEPPRLTWCLLVEGPAIPHPDEGCELPVLVPVYAHSYDLGKDIHYESHFVRMNISEDHHLALRVD